MVNSSAVAIRGLLVKEDAPSIRLEICRTSASDFEIIENGRAIGVLYRALTYPKLDNYMELGEAWQKCIAQRYPGYQVSEVEEAKLG